MPVTFKTQERRGDRNVTARNAQRRTVRESLPAGGRMSGACACGGGCPRCNSKPVQAKLSVSQPGDTLEQEADRVAEQVMRRPGTQLQPGNNAMPAAAPLTISPLQKGSGETHTQAGGRVQDVIASPGPGSALPESVLGNIEPVLGADLSTVRVHSDARSQQAAKEINAKAFTNRNHIHLGAGQSREDIALMAHEATHVVQQTGTTSNEEVQRASLISDGERFAVVGSEGSYFTFGDLVSAVKRRYQLDDRSTYHLARWLDERHGIFRYGDRRYDEPVIPMPRMVAFFLVDWVEPFTAYGGTYGISPDAFDKAQQIWAQENIFVGFRAGGPVGDATFEQIDFAPGAGPDGTPNRNTLEELNLLALRSRGGLPPGYFHIVVTGDTTEDATATGKSVRSRGDEPVAAGSEGILLFAGSYTRLGYQQVVPRGDNGQELGELLAHEIGHFLFGLNHNRPAEFTAEGMVVRPKTDIMRGGAQMDPNDSIGADSRAEIEQAFRGGGIIPRPETATSRTPAIQRKMNSADREIPVGTIGGFTGGIERR